MLALLLMAAAPDGAFFLVIDNTKGGVTAIEYPNAARCELAKRAVSAEFQRRVAEATRNAETSGGITIDYGPMPSAYCIPA